MRMRLGPMVVRNCRQSAIVWQQRAGETVRLGDWETGSVGFMVLEVFQSSESRLQPVG